MSAKHDIDIDIHPKVAVLRALGLSRADFTRALVTALDQLAETPKGELPVPSDIPILLQGNTHRLGDLAWIDVAFASGRHARL